MRKFVKMTGHTYAYNNLTNFRRGIFDIWNLCAIKSDSDDCSDNNEHVAVDISDLEVCVVASNSGLAGHTAPEKSVNVLQV